MGMTAVPEELDMTDFYLFVRNNNQLLDLNCDGMFKAAHQVKTIIKAISK